MSGVTTNSIGQQIFVHLELIQRDGNGRFLWSDMYKYEADGTVEQDTVEQLLTEVGFAQVASDD